jgi:hypothetical protein
MCIGKVVCYLPRIIDHLSFFAQKPPNFKKQPQKGYKNMYGRMYLPYITVDGIHRRLVAMGNFMSKYGVKIGLALGGYILGLMTPRVISAVKNKKTKQLPAKEEGESEEGESAE